MTASCFSVRFDGRSAGFGPFFCSEDFSAVSFKSFQILSRVSPLLSHERRTFVKHLAPGFAPRVAHDRRGFYLFQGSWLVAVFAPHLYLDNGRENMCLETPQVDALLDGKYPVRMKKADRTEPLSLFDDLPAV